MTKSCVPRPRPGRDPGRGAALALQGGGAHGAFTWGVLDRLLEDALQVDAICGVFSGALIGVTLAQELVRGGSAGARGAMGVLWRRFDQGHIRHAARPDYLVQAQQRAGIPVSVVQRRADGCYGPRPATVGRRTIASPRQTADIGDHASVIQVTPTRRPDATTASHCLLRWQAARASGSRLRHADRLSTPCVAITRVAIVPVDYVRLDHIWLNERWLD